MGGLHFTAGPGNTQHIFLDGQLSGGWSVTPAVPDVGQTQVLTGDGEVSPLHHVHAQGTISSPGNIAAGHTHGEMVLTDKFGSITIHLVGAPLQAAFSGPPDKFYFAIDGGTGKYAHAWGGGVVNLHEMKGPGDHQTDAHFTMTFHAYH
jgi:hypothetical protein